MVQTLIFINITLSYLEASRGPNWKTTWLYYVPREDANIILTVFLLMNLLV